MQNTYSEEVASLIPDRARWGQEQKGAVDRVETVIVRKGIDRAIGLLAIVFTSPLFVLAAAAIAIEALLVGENPNVVFSEKRLSACKQFSMFKFRVIPVELLTSYLREQPLDSVRLLERNSRNLTRTGRVLRSLHIDQLPQLFNVLRGDMCFVGPRPYSVREWAEDPRVRIPARRVLKAGLIGPYQARTGPAVGGSAANQADMDYFAYAQTASTMKLLGRDLRIAFRAAGTALDRNNSKQHS